MKKFLQTFMIGLFVSCSSSEDTPAPTGSAPTNPTPLHTAIDPVPKTEDWWQNLHFEDKQLLQTEQYEMIFLGNSIMHNWESTGQAEWNEHYADRTLNMGIGSDQTQHLLWRVKDADFTSVDPKLAVLQIGTNNSNGNRNTAQQIFEGIEAICQELKNKLPDTKILVLGIFPRNEVGTLQRNKVEQCNSLVAGMADEVDVFYRDFGPIFLNVDGSINTEIMPDKVHPNLEGYRMWVEEMDEIITVLTK